MPYAQEDEHYVRKYVKTLRPGHSMNPVSANNGLIYEVITQEGGTRYIRHKDIARIRGATFKLAPVEPVPPNKRGRQKRKSKNIQKTRRKRRA